MKILKLLSILILFAACQNDGSVKKSNSAALPEDPLELETFVAIQLDIDSRVIVLRGDEQKVEVNGPVYQIQKLNKKVDNRVWKIKYEEEIEDPEPMIITITIPDLVWVEVNGSGSVMINKEVTNKVKTTFSMSGTGLIRSMTNNNALIVSKIDGSGDIELLGLCKKLQVESNGSGKFKGHKLVVDTVEASLSGSSDLFFNIKDHLEARISGSGSISYLGEPTVSKEVTGSGSIIQQK